MYQISQITTFDEDKLLYETYVGLTNKEMTLICSGWGETEAESRIVANSMCNLLNKKAEVETC
jgi:hypothetical protein